MHTVFSKTANSLISLDESNLQVTVYRIQGSEIMVRTVQVASILDIQLSVNTSISTTGIVSSIGLQGSAIGVGKDFTHSDVRSIVMRIVLNDTCTPFFVHEFLSSTAYGKFEEGSAYVREALENANRTKAILDVLIHRVKT
jgi:hypothetical protein